MRLLFDIGHPAHVHLFKYFAREMQEQRHEVLFTTRQKDLTVQLLEESDLPFINLGKSGVGIISKVFKMFYFNYKLLGIARKFKPDYYLSHGSIYAAHVSYLLGKPHISFEDTGNMEQIMFYRPFTEIILVSDSFKKKLGNKTVVYPGYHELAYLHPKRFKPNPEILLKYNIHPGTNIILVRFVSWNASHDLNHKGIPFDLKLKVVETLSKYGKVLISSESQLPTVLQEYQININPTDIFDIMAQCRLVFGESGTMASEAAVLGVPAIYIDSVSRDYTQEQEKKYGLVSNFSEEASEIIKAIYTAEQILLDPEGQAKYAERRKKLLEDKVDVTGFLKNFILKYHETKMLVPK